MDLFADRKEPGAPLVQLCVDVRSLTEAVEVGKMGLRAGVDWLELGTPMISWIGINALDGFSSEFPDEVKFLDAKVMDASVPYVESAGKLGIQLVCLCASASDATFRAAVAAGKAADIKIVGDLYAVSDPISRAQELVELGVDAIYLHYGYDEQNEDLDADPSLEYLAELKRLISLPIGIVTPNTEAGEAAARIGADVLLVSHPFLVGPEAEAKLGDYVRRVRAAASSA